MINKRDILSMVRQVNRRSHGLEVRRLIHPEREWWIGLILFLIIVVLGGLGNVYLYHRYAVIKDNLQAPQPPKVAYREALVASVLSDYRARQASFTRQLSSYAQAASRLPALDPQTSTTTASTTQGELSAAEESLKSEAAAASSSDFSQ